MWRDQQRKMRAIKAMMKAAKAKAKQGTKGTNAVKKNTIEAKKEATTSVSLYLSESITTADKCTQTEPLRTVIKKEVAKEEALLREILTKRLYEGPGIGGIGVFNEMLVRTMGDCVYLGRFVDCVGPLGRLRESSLW